ncbi:MAG: alginate export family protein, partial [Gemmataceae bacterium]|nr:alginate export family protein [Gemmataceae bacterium]
GSPDPATPTDRRSPTNEGDLRSAPVARSGDRATTGGDRATTARSGDRATTGAEGAKEPADPCAKKDKGDKKDKDSKKDEPKDPWVEFWKKVPPVRIFPPPGNISVPPSGPGYYSLRDLVTGTYRDKPPRFPYPPFALMSPSFFDADFRYLEDPKNTQHDFFDPLHRIHLGDDWLFNTGGQAWWRHMHEVNSQLSGVTNNYDLLRLRVYGDLWYCDRFRVYVEFISADSYHENRLPALIDVDRADLQNAFIDVKLCEIDGKPAYVRVGRQELLFGSQRLISPPDWANVRRTFQGVRAFRQGEKFDVDLFWVQPVIPNANRFNSVDNNVNFAGLWTTYRPQKGQFLDAYYLFLDNTSPITRLGVTSSPHTTHTLGMRYAGRKEQFLWDLEPILQLGDRGSQDITAASVSAGLGWNFKDLPANPTFWAYYDYATGDSSPGRGAYSTFNQLFAFGHYYLGWLDLVGRQNIQDVNCHLYLYPTKWITLIGQFHHFTLAASQDALYNAAGVAIRRDPTGRAGRDVGNEIDLIVNFHLGPHSDILTGWSKLYAGSFIERTAATAAGRISPELFYFMYNFRW